MPLDKYLFTPGDPIPAENLDSIDPDNIPADLSSEAYKLLRLNSSGEISENFFRKGGTGVDGALAITSGITTIDLGGAAYVEKNYSSISITGTGKLAFSNPNANGTIIVLRSKGDVVLTSSTSPLIDVSGLGGAQVNGASGNGNVAAGNEGKGFILKNNAPALPAGSVPYATAQVGGVSNRILSCNILSVALNTLCPGSSGGGGTITGSATPTGGAGGGALYIECGGSLTFTGTIDASGKNGGNAGSTGSGNTILSGAGGSSVLANGNNGNIATTNGSGAGGGGGGGVVIIAYNILVSNTGTITTDGGNRGTAYGVEGGDGADGYSKVLSFY